MSRSGVGVRRFGKMLSGIAVVLVTIQALFPLLFMFITSLKTRRDLFAGNSFWQFSPTLDNYYGVLQQHNFAFYLNNSMVIALGATALTLLLGAFAGYALSWYRFPGKNTLLIGVIALRMIPPIALVIPLFDLSGKFGLRDTHLILILLESALNLPFVIWLLKGFFDELPRELIEAAIVDGCTTFGAFFRIAVPLVKPGLFATAALTFILTWNDFLFPLVLTSTDATTLPIMAANFMTEEGVQWGNLAAAGTMILLPVVIFSLLTQRLLVKGMTQGGVKG